MAWVPFIEGVAFSTLLLLLSFCVEYALGHGVAFPWVILCAALFPLWLALASASARMGRVRCAELEWAELAGPFHGTRTLPSRRDGILGSAGALLGVGFFFSVVPPAWGLATLGWAALLFVLEKRRLTLQIRRQTLTRRERDLLRRTLRENLRGLRTFRSLGAERFLERRLGDRFALFLSRVRSATIAEGWLEQLLPVFVVAGLCGLLTQVYRQSPMLVVSVGFMGWAAYCAVQRAAAVTVERLGARTRKVATAHPLIPLRSMGEKLERIRRFEFEDLVLDEASGRFGSFDLQLTRGRVHFLTQPDLQDVRWVLGALAGLVPARSGTVVARDAEGNILWRHEADRGSLVPSDWVAYWERRPVFLPGSIRENLLLGNPDHRSDWRVWEILEKLGADGLVRELGGLDSVLPVDACDRSELLLLSLVRALIPGRPLLVMEHPGFVGEWEWLQERLYRFKDFPATVVGAVMTPSLSVAREVPIPTRAEEPRVEAHGGL